VKEYYSHEIYNSKRSCKKWNIAVRSVQNHCINNKIPSGFAPLPDFTIEQNEILVLMPGSVPLETIAKIKNIPLQKVEEVVCISFF